MGIIVIGLGSMGKRRIRLLKSESMDTNIIGVDSSQERRENCHSIYNIKCYETIEQAISAEQINIAFVCTPPLTHHSIIKKCLLSGCNVFTELNLVSDGYDELLKIAKEENRIIFQSATLLYREEIKYIVDRINSYNGKLNYCYHVGQYLPDWHPWEKYNEYFIGNKLSNGCREIFAIEFPWLVKAFGDVKSFTKMSSKCTGLDIDFNDNYIVMLEHGTGHKGVFLVDVVARKPIRKFEVYGEELLIEWEGTPETLTTFDIESKTSLNIETYKDIVRDNNYSDLIIENEYLDEIRDFFAELMGNGKKIYSMIEDKKTLNLIDRIERKD